MAIFENTYRLEPLEEERFFPSKVEVVVERVIREMFDGKSFDAEQAAQWAQQASSRLLEEVRELHMPRFKLIVQVVVCENAGQGIRVASKSLWDTNFDNWGSYTHVQGDMYVVAMVFGCYHE